MSFQYSQKLFYLGVVSVAVLAGVGMGLFWVTRTDDGFSQQGLDNQGGDERPGRLYITTMTHMEADFKDDEDRDLFFKHVKQIRWAIDLFDEYGAKLTIESEASFARANTKWGTNVLQEVLDHGHGVGTHADFGASPADSSITLEELTGYFIENKTLVDDLVGAENNRGVSGGTGYGDWVLAASAAGFQYMDGVTGFGYLSMPLRERPDGWTDAYIRSVGYHDPIPLDFSERMYPLPLANAEDLVADDDPVIVVVGGDIGELASLSEGRNACSPNCKLTEDDVHVIQNSLDEALADLEPGKVARINMHIPLVLFDKKNEEVLRSFLAMIKTYVDAGKITWETQGEFFDTYEASK